MPHVIMRARLGLSQTHRQQWFGTVQRLGLSLLICAQHQRLVRWVQIQADDVPHIWPAAFVPMNRLKRPKNHLSRQRIVCLE